MSRANRYIAFPQYTHKKKRTPYLIVTGFSSTTAVVIAYKNCKRKEEARKPPHKNCGVQGKQTILVSFHRANLLNASLLLAEDNRL